MCCTGLKWRTQRVLADLYWEEQVWALKQSWTQRLVNAVLGAGWNWTKGLEQFGAGCWLEVVRTTGVVKSWVLTGAGPDDWSGEVLGAKWTGSGLSHIGLTLERGVDSHRPQKLQPDCSWTADPFYKKRTDKTGSHLWRVKFVREVFGWQPHLVSNLVNWSLGTATVSGHWSRRGAEWATI